jgi:hypothetical protein
LRMTDRLVRGADQIRMILTPVIAQLEGSVANVAVFSQLILYQTVTIAIHVSSPIAQACYQRRRQLLRAVLQNTFIAARSINLHEPQFLPRKRRSRLPVEFTGQPIVGNMAL